MSTLWSTASLVTGGLIRLRGPRTGASLYLTFDDGPHPVHTPAVMDVLERHDAKGSFYLIGREAQRHGEVVRRLVDAGHVIGNHSMAHPKMRALPARAQWREIADADAVLATYDGQPRHPFRPPNGRVTLPVVAASVLHRQRLALWSVDSLDYKLGAAAVIERLSGLPLVDGDVILFHDDAATVVEVLEAMLPRWAAAGFRFPAFT